MDASWNWPGARWWRCDLHLHSMASFDWRSPDTTPEQWVDAAIQAGLEVVAATDHNTGAWLDTLRPAAAAAGLTLFAGVEVTSHEGIHVLAFRDESVGTPHVEELLTQLEVPLDDRGRSTAKSEKNVEGVLRCATERGWLCIAAHADRLPQEDNSSTASLMTNLAGSRGRLLAILDSTDLAAAEVIENDAERRADLRGAGRPGRRRREPGLALVHFSDAHTLEQVGRRSTWIKMTAPTREGLELALSDGDHSVLEAGDVAPNTPPARAIASLTIRDLKHAGKPMPLEVEFSPWLTVIIGGRGAGKSTLINSLRVALRRDTDAHGEAERVVARFARIGGRRDAGALTTDTRLQVVYERDGHRLRAGWSHDGSLPALEEWDGQDGWTAAEGDVRQRLPARILGQGELNALAEDTGRVLALADETPEVDRREWQTAWDAEQARFLALRAQGRQTAAQLPDVSLIRGELADVTRSLAVLESPAHRDTLQRLQRVRGQQRTLDQWLSRVREVAGTLVDAAAASVVEDPPLERFADVAELPLRQTLHEHADALTAAIEATAEAARDVAALAERGPNGATMAAWAGTVEATEAAYRSLNEELASTSGVEPARYGELIQRRQELESRLEGVDRTREAVASLEQQAKQSLARLGDLRQNLSERRARFFASIADDGGLVQFELVPLGDRDGARAELRELLLGDPMGTTFGGDLDKCVEQLSSPSSTLPENLVALKSTVRDAAAGAGAGAFDGRFVNRVGTLRPEALDQLDAWFPDDLLELSYRDAGGGRRAIAQGSSGQKNAAILAFLLSYGDEPLVIDQPENDLDNALISDLVVTQLRASKPRRQLIIVTHNPNIVVNADADYVIALEFSGGQVHVRQSGGLQEQAIRDEVCRIVEGGREAFESRYSRIGRRHV